MRQLLVEPELNEGAGRETVHRVVFYSCRHAALWHHACIMYT